MKLKYFVVIFLISLSYSAFANNDNFLNKDWWKTATLEDVKQELKNGADVNAKKSSFLYGQRSVLSIAIKYNTKSAIIAALIKAGADINFRDMDDNTVLHIALMHKKNLTISKILLGAVVTTLIEAGVDINAKNKNDDTPLDIAKQHNKSVVNNLIKLGATTGVKVKQQDFLDINWWKVAMLKDVKQGIDNGLDVNAKNEKGKTPLHIATRYNENLEIIKTLIKAGSNINAMTTKGYAPIHYAAYKNKNPEIIKLLISKGANVNDAKNKNGTTPLMSAAYRKDKNIGIINALLDGGADVNIKNKKGKTPLMIAVYSKNKNISIINALLDGGADVNIKNNKGWTAYTYAVGLVNPKTDKKTSKWNKSDPIVARLITTEMKQAELAKLQAKQKRLVRERERQIEREQEEQRELERASNAGSDALWDFAGSLLSAYVDHRIDREEQKSFQREQERQNRNAAIARKKANQAEFDRQDAELRRQIREQRNAENRQYEIAAAQQRQQQYAEQQRQANKKQREQHNNISGKCVKIIDHQTKDLVGAKNICDVDISIHHCFHSGTRAKKGNMYDYNGAIPLVRCKTGQKMTTQATGNFNDCDKVRPGKTCVFYNKRIFQSGYKIHYAYNACKAYSLFKIYGGRCK